MSVVSCPVSVVAAPMINVLYYVGPAGTGQTPKPVTPTFSESNPSPTAPPTAQSVSSPTTPANGSSSSSSSSANQDQSSTSVLNTEERANTTPFTGKLGQQGTNSTKIEGLGDSAAAGKSARPSLNKEDLSKAVQDECGRYGCDGSGIVAVVVVGVICFAVVLVVVAILIKKVVDERRKKKFRNVDYLINGMYT